MTETTYYLKPGFMFATGDPTAVTTVLGSCVSVCLFDRNRRLGGITHYLLPSSTSPSERSTRFGDVAIGELARVLMEWGSGPRDLEATLIGGASIEHSSTSEWVAKENVAVAHRILTNWQIALMGVETGGYRGRKLVFHTATGRVEWAFLSKEARVEQDQSLDR